MSVLFEVSHRESEIDRHRARNLLACVLNESGWGVAMAFVHYVTILPIFLHGLGASPQVIALIPAVAGFSYAVPQLLFAKLTAHVERKRILLVFLHLLGREDGLQGLRQDLVDPGLALRVHHAGDLG